MSRRSSSPRSRSAGAGEAVTASATPQRIEAPALSQAGIDALRSGNAAAARELFESITASGQAEAHHWVCLALACKALRDEDAMVRACDEALKLEPRNLSALILKGDHFVGKGNLRAATQFYGVAVAVGSGIPGLPHAIAAEVHRAAEARERINAHITRHLGAELVARGYDEKASSPRFTQSLDILTGRKQPYAQQPRAYFFPELPPIQFYARDAFPWLDAVEAATDDICAELEAILRGGNEFMPYITPDPSAPARNDQTLLNSMDWSAFFLWKDGLPVPENARRCPATLAALEQVPLVRIKDRAPSILFSMLRPGARIEPHTGFVNTRLICHLPLVVPPGCHFRVGNDVRQWRRGEAWAFDDTIEHEAWNAGDQRRVILIFDVWRPELTSEERSLVADLLEAVDSYPGGESVHWR